MMQAQPDMPLGGTIEARRADFPALQQTVNGHPLVYLDSAASSQMPGAVIGLFLVVLIVI
jgi:selenocysteine lyase/cysteine desulfurase